jgi:tripartite ATP-independent transporter DctM subunit
MLVCAGYARKKNYPVGVRLPISVVLPRIAAAIPSLLMIVLVIGGIISGAFTATEAGAIAVVYSFVLAVLVYREVKWQDLGNILLKSAETTAIVLALIATSAAMSWILSYENIPQSISAALLALSDNPLLILLIINIILLIVGAFMDMTPAVLIFTPIFLPVAMELGVSPLHFGIMMILNLSIGLVSPPVGSVLFVACAVAKVKLEQLLRPLLPMYAAMIVVLLLVTYVPAISEWLPNAVGL